MSISSRDWKFLNFIVGVVLSVGDVDGFAQAGTSGSGRGTGQNVNQNLFVIVSPLQ